MLILIPSASDSAAPVQAGGHIICKKAGMRPLNPPPSEHWLHLENLSINVMSDKVQSCLPSVNQALSMFVQRPEKTKKNPKAKHALQAVIGPLLLCSGHLTEGTNRCYFLTSMSVIAAMTQQYQLSFL